MAGPIDAESVGKRWLARARRVVALEVRSAAGLWCFASVLEFAGVPSGLLGESSFVVLWSWSDLLPEFASLEREGDLRRWLNCVLCVHVWVREWRTYWLINRTVDWCVGECWLEEDKFSGLSMVSFSVIRRQN